MPRFTLSATAAALALAMPSAAAQPAAPPPTFAPTFAPASIPAVPPAMLRHCADVGVDGALTIFFNQGRPRDQVAAGDAWFAQLVCRAVLARSPALEALVRPWFAAAPDAAETDKLRAENAALKARIAAAEKALRGE